MENVNPPVEAVKSALMVAVHQPAMIVRTALITLAHLNVGIVISATMMNVFPPAVYALVVVMESVSQLIAQNVTFALMMNAIINVVIVRYVRMESASQCVEIVRCASMANVKKSAMIVRCVRIMSVSLRFVKENVMFA